MTTHLTMTIEFRDKLITSLRRDVESYTGGTARGNNNKRESLRGAMNLLRGLLSMNERAYARFCVATVASSDAATFASVADGDTLVIGGTTLTAKTSPSGSVQFKRGVSDTADAAAAAACINANTTLNKLVRATSSGAVVTITCLYPGPIGDQIAVSTTGGTISLAHATLSGGASDTVDGYQFGYAPTT